MQGEAWRACLPGKGLLCQLLPMPMPMGCPCALLRALQSWDVELLARGELCPAERVVMLWATSKSVQALLGRLHLRMPAFVRVKACAAMETVAGGLPRLMAWCSVVTLDFCGRGFGVEVVRKLAGLLGQCTSLAMLNLTGNAIGDEGAQGLAGVLGQCSSLAALELRENEIGDEGARSLAQVLGECSSLATLDLGYNMIGDEGAQSLARGLVECPSLATLDLGYNMIGVDGALGLASVLRQRSSLGKLNLSGNEGEMMLFIMIAEEVLYVFFQGIFDDHDQHPLLEE